MRGWTDGVDVGDDFSGGPGVWFIVSGRVLAVKIVSAAAPQKAALPNGATRPLARWN